MHSVISLKLIWHIYMFLNTLSGGKSCLVVPGVAVLPRATETVITLGWRVMMAGPCTCFHMYDENFLWYCGNFMLKKIFLFVSCPQSIFEKIPWCLLHWPMSIVHSHWGLWCLESHDRPCCLLHQKTPAGPPTKTKDTRGRTATLCYQTLTSAAAVATCVYQSHIGLVNHKEYLQSMWTTFFFCKVKP